MEKIWLNGYPPGVPAEINPDLYQSIVELFEKSCERFSNLPAFYNAGTTLSYNELNKLSRAFAAYLQQVLRLPKGTHLAIMLPNLLHYPIVFFGALRAGLVVVNVNPLYTAPELARQLNDSDAETMVVLEDYTHTLEKVIVQTKVKQVFVARASDFLSPIRTFAARCKLKYFQRKITARRLPSMLYFKKIIEDGEHLELYPVHLEAGDLALLQYTGGTTGIAKGAMLTHRNILANIEQTYTWLQLQSHVGEKVVLTALPLYHISSLLLNCLLYTIKVGALNVLITNPRDTSKMLDEMTKFKFSCIIAVNTFFKILLKTPRFASLDFSQLQLTIGGGMALQQTVAEKWQALTGCVLLEGYGLTEASPCVAFNPPDSKTFSGNVGFPLPSTEIRILDEKAQELPPGHYGELAVKGPQVIESFWQQPEAKWAFPEKGWLLTGDNAVLDAQGRLHILDRKKDMILVSGFNVYPNEVETVIAAIPAVAEVAIVGVNDDLSGEAVKAFIVKNEAALTVEEVLHRCRAELAAYKVPKHVEFCETLPKSSMEKILRRSLRS